MEKLASQGQREAADRLERLLASMDQEMQTASWLERHRKRLSAILSRHHQYAEKELAQTAHLLSVARKLIIDRKPVSEKDKERARSQFMDLLKTVPASAILAGTLLIPLPGAQPILAPILMQRLGLLPSAWTADTDVVKDLSDLSAIASSAGLSDVAMELDQLAGAARKEAAKSAALAGFLREHSDWRVLFDEDLDRKVSGQELLALRRRVVLTALEVRSVGSSRVWYVYYKHPDEAIPLDLDKTSQFRMDAMGETVKGPYTFTEVTERFPVGSPVLIRRGVSGGWVPLVSVSEELEDHKTSMQSP